MKTHLLSLALLLAALFNYLTAYGLPPLAPTLRYQDETYRLAVNRPISIFILNSIRFVDKYSGSNINYITLEPYTIFGYADLLWNTSKVPRHGAITLSPHPDIAVKTIETIINDAKNAIVPLYLTDKLSGRIGLKSYYEKPFYLLSQQSSLVYNNLYYSLFFTGD